MKILERYYKEILILLGVLILYFLLRLPNLTLQPIFADEAIYIRWAQVMRAEPTLRFLPLSDGKTPLFMWSIIPLFKLFEDPLFAGRFLSVLSGFATLVGVFFVSLRLFNFKVAAWSALFYAVVPFAVFFDRMALVDSMLASFTIWSFYFAVWLLKSQRLDLAMILGYMLGGGLLTKTPAMLNILVLPFTLVGLKFKNAKKLSLIKLLIFWAVAVILALAMYNILRLGPGFHQLSSRNADYIFSPWELVQRPLDPFIPHLRVLADWFPKLLTWPILILLFFSLWIIVKTKHRLGLALFFWSVAPLLIQTAFLKTFTARYILFSIPPLLILAAFGLENLLDKLNSRKYFLIFLSVVLILPFSLYFDFLNLTKPETAPLPAEERKGYFEEWTAGYGFKEISEFLIDKRKEGPVLVGTEGFFGTLPDGLLIYLDKSGIPVVGDQATISAKLKSAARFNQTFFVGSKSRVGENLPGGKLIKEYPKAKSLTGTQDATLLYRVISEDE